MTAHCAVRAIPLFTLRDADKLLGEVGVELEDFDRGGNADGSDFTVQIHHRVAQRRQHVRGTPGPDAARILGERHIADGVQFVLDRPVIAGEVPKCVRIRLVGRKARHTIRHFDRRHPRHGPLAGDLIALFEAFPLVTQCQQRCRAERPSLDPTVRFVDRGRHAIR